jgi:hypothetical protein
LCSMAYNFFLKSGVHNNKHARYRAALDLDFALEFVGIS